VRGIQILKGHLPRGGSPTPRSRVPARGRKTVSRSCAGSRPIRAAPARPFLPTLLPRPSVITRQFHHKSPAFPRATTNSRPRQPPMPTLRSATANSSQAASPSPAASSTPRNVKRRLTPGRPGQSPTDASRHTSPHRSPHAGAGTVRSFAPPLGPRC
jgi:hypothetical protein